MKKTAKYLLIPLSLGLLASCGPSISSESIPEPDSKGIKDLSVDVDFYDNNDFNDYATAGNSLIKGQQSGVGIGDPYILRYNGMYYLYAANTTLNGGKSGIMAWKSPDLMNWTQCQGQGLDKGYVSSPSDSSTMGAYAPEVHYSNGLFYMYESKFSATAKGAGGHHILVSTSPEGPFKEVSGGEIDTYSDGTVVQDQYENLFFLTAGTGGINTGTMSSMTRVIDTKNTVVSTNMAGTTSESPSVFEYMGKYYLTYSGLHEGVGSYQVCYSVSQGWGNDDTPEGISSSFKKGANLPLLVNADKEEGFTNLGSSSAVMGPDLDSYYLAYQCMNKRKGRDRSFNLDRLVIAGDYLATSPNRYGSVKPKLPEYRVNNGTEMEHVGAFSLSNVATEETFSAEYNFENGKGSRAVFSYKDESNYHYAQVGFDSGGIRVVKVENNIEKQLASSTIFGSFDPSVLHTLRIAYRDGKFDLHFDGLLKMNAIDLVLEGGKIGYKGADELKIGYTAFSNVARGLSNEQEIKQANAENPAALITPKDFVEGLPSYSLSEKSGIATIENDVEYSGTQSLTLGRKYDFARYLVNFNEDSRYSLELVVNKAAAGKTIRVELDDGEDMDFTIPAYYGEGEEGKSRYMRVELGDFAIEKGIRQIKLQSMGDPIEIVSYHFAKKGQPDYYYANALQNENITGMMIAEDSTWNFASKAIHSNKSERNFASVGEKHLHDFDMQVEVSLPTPSLYTLSSEAGIAFHVSNYAMYSDGSDGEYTDVEKATNEYAFQGYYLALTTMDANLYRVNFSGEKTVSLKKVSSIISAMKYHTISVSQRGNRITAWLDGKELLSYCDDLGYGSGQVGIYASKGEIS
ncbi:MAG: family 43 glycosylhydrolase, partial [Bacilli bacterium]|nr:family 43 glycosylhydrolase [Bacilli bacterium]